MKANELVEVATIHEESADRVRRALKEANVPALTRVSLGTHGIRVRKRDRDRALSILEKDAKEHGYWIRLHR